MVDAVSSSLTGIFNATDRLAKSAEKIASGSADLAQEVVESKLAATNFEANVTVLKATLDTERKILDILA